MLIYLIDILTYKKTHRRPLVYNSTFRIVFVDPLSVSAGSDALDPSFMFEIPMNSLLKPFNKTQGLPPPQIPLEFRTVDRIPPIVSRPILYKPDEVSVLFRIASRYLPHDPAEGMDELDVLPLVLSPYSVRLPCCSVPHDGPHCAVMIFHIKPVPDVPSVGVSRPSCSIS